jgi:hypothetical protein
MVAQGRYGIIYVSLIQVVQLHNRYNILNRNHKQIVYLFTKTYLHLKDHRFNIYFL